MHSVAPSRNTLVIVALVLWATMGFAQDSVLLPQGVTAARRTLVVIPVTGTLVAGGVTRIVIDYPADVVRIRRAAGGDEFAFKCKTLFVDQDTMVSSTVGRITLVCWDVVPVTNDTICTVEAEILAGPGTSGIMKPIRLDRNQIPVQDVQFSSASITAEGLGATSEPVEGITGNYPNPFHESSEFVFRLLEPGPVHLSVHSIDGRRVLDVATIQATAGENHYQFVYDVWDLAVGPYIMSVETETKTFLHQFMILK